MCPRLEVVGIRRIDSDVEIRRIGARDKFARIRFERMVASREPVNPVRHTNHSRRLVTCLITAVFGVSSAPAQDHQPTRAFVSQYCADCHDNESKKGNLDLVNIPSLRAGENPEVWEKVVRKLRTRQMPPPDKKNRPEEQAFKAVLARLETSLDSAAAKRPNPGRTETLRRLNRTEYQNAVRDLLALDIDATTLLPKDDAGHGFDNVNVGTLSPTLLDRYIIAAQKISRLAVGTTQRVGGDTIRLAADRTQEEHVEGLPLGTRGGALIPYTFPQDADYEIQIRLTRDRNDEVEGLREKHEVQVLMDREVVASFTVEPPKDKNFDKVDRHLKARIPVKAGPHQVGVTFLKNPSSLLEAKRQPYNVHFNMHRHPRLGPAVYQVSINGPYDAKGPGDTPSRQRIFVAKPKKPQDEEMCAKQIFSSLAHRAYRRPVTDADLEKPLALYREARKEKDFDAGVEVGLSAILVSPNFLFRVEHDPERVAPGTAYRISDLELASRLSFFIWTSIPDNELLAVAERGDLHKPAVLEKQTRRMLADPRAESLASNFAGQWLYLRNLDSFTPDLRLYPDFDDNLRQALREETELFFVNILREDRSVLEMLKADYTFLDERLAKHYGVPHVYGSRFRRVSTAENGRGGLLRHGSILAVTSYATRTSPVLRGKFVLENFIGTPPPPPLPDVPTLKDNTISAMLSVRERLAEHRANAQCASCHNMIDPPGFTLENFDALGRWRNLEEAKPVDASGGLPDGNKFNGIDGLEQGLLNRPEVFASTLTEKLLTFALGRGVEYYDAPAVRKIVREATENDYKFSSIIVGITKSTPFTMRRSQ
jgi:mono/diheme cytochrome c family protein